MAVPTPAVPFFLRLANGRTCSAVEFPDGFVCVYRPDEFNICTIAVSVNALLEDRAPDDPLCGAVVEHYER